MSAPDPKRQLNDLDAKLAAFKAGRKLEKKHQEEHYSQANIAWRMVTEMVAGLGSGFGLGYGLDMVLGTAPFLMVIFALLGIVAGIKVMLRTAAEVQATQMAVTPGHNGADAPEADKGARSGANEGNRDGS